MQQKTTISTGKRQRCLKVLAAGLAAFLFFALMPLAAQATITVTHSASGAGTGTYTTLNQAINACTTTSGTYTIKADANHNLNDACTVKANVRINLQSNVSGTKRTITRMKKGISIIVSGTLTVTDIVFNGGGETYGEASMIENSGTLTMSNCTIQNAKTTPNPNAGYNLPLHNGGGLRNSGTATLTNCTITNCNGNCGGAIYHNGSNKTLTITGGSYTSNTGYGYGGCIAAIGGIVNINGATISNNTAGGNGYNYGSGLGGGIYVGASTPVTTINLTGATTINNNTALCAGGGIYNLGTVNCTGTASLTMTGNKANRTENGMGVYGGGAISNGDKNLNKGTINFTSSGTKNISSNSTTEDGGGIYNFNGTVTLSNCTINNNTASKAGGGICNVYGTYEVYSGHYQTYEGTLNCTGTSTLTMTGNSAGTHGGGIYNSGILTLSSTGTKTFYSNKAPNGNGGAIWTGNGGTLTNCTVGASGKANTSLNGGGVYLNAGALTVSGGTYAYNTASENGGGLYLNGGTATFSNSPSVTNNGAKNGGGIYTNINVTLPNGMSVSSNTASASGGGLYVPSGKTLTLQNPTINNNTAATGGGGIYNLGTVSCTGSYALTMSGNKTTGNHGGAIHNRGTLTLTSTGAKSFTNNTSNGSGGGIINYEGGTMTLNNGTISFTNNTATNNHGGAIYTNTALNMSGATAVTFTDNTAKVHGGAIYCTGAAVTLSGTANTLTNNKAGTGASGNGGAVSCAGLTCAGTLTMTGNQAGTADIVGHGGGIYSTAAVTLSGTTTKTINTNKAPKGNGGAIWTGGGGTLTGCTMGASGKANTALNGGGVYLNAGALTVSGGTYAYNTATTAGGGFYFAGGSASFSGIVSVANNSATDGAGIWTGINLTLPSTLSLSNNTASTNGGGIYLSGAKTLTLNGTISGNSAKWGGGVYTKWSEANTVVCNAGTAVNSNTASTNGGGFYIHNGCSLSIAGATNINSNTATTSGGGVFVAASGTMTCTGNAALTMTGNTATNDHGGAIHNTGTLTLSSTGAKAFTKNNATNGNGGAIYTTNGGTLTNCTLGGSVANKNQAKNGGGVLNNGGTLTVSGGNCTYNTASANGGGYYLLSGTANFSVNHTISHNEASQFGGGVYIATNALMGVSGTVTVKDNTTTRSGAPYDPYLKDSKEDDVCLQTLNDNNPEGSIGKIQLKGTIDGSKIGITEQPVASGYDRALDAAGNKIRQFTVNYGTYYSSKAAEDVFFSNDRELGIFLLTHPHPGTTTGLLEVTLGAEPILSWYVAGIVDDNGLTWGNDANTGLAPDVPLRTLTGPQGVFAKGYNPLTDHVFVVRAVSAQAEAAAGRLTEGKVVVRYPDGASAATFLGNTTAIADATGSEEVILYRYPGGHRLVNGLADNGGATVAGQVASGSQNGPGANTGPVFAMDNTTNEAKLYNIHMDGLSEYSKETGVTNADIDELDPQHTHNPSYLRIDPKSALLAVEAGTATITLNEHCDILMNENKYATEATAFSGRERRPGGGVYCAGTLVCNGVTIFKNKCALNGGGMFVAPGGTVTMASQTIEETYLSVIGGGDNDANTANNGGGIYIDGAQGNAGRVNLNEGCTVTYNTASSQGGGVYINANAAMSINGTDTGGVLIKYNHAKTAGGGVYKLGSLSVGGLVVITDNTVDAK